MQKTEKHCKNQCFCYHKTTKISPKTGPKTQKSASGPGHLRNRKKRCCKPKNWGQKVEKHKVFSLFACRFWTGAFTNRCLPYCFLQCFLKASVTTYQKQEVLAEKCPPPGKPVTFYECHPDDHAPAPSVRADLMAPEVEHSSEAGGVVEPIRLLGPSSAMDRNIPWRRTWRWFWIPRRIPRGFGAPKTREGFTWEIPQFLEGSKQQHKIEWCRAAGSREFWMMVIWYL